MSIPKHRNKQGAVIDALTTLALDRGPGIKLPTMKELSSLLGVTVTTLDRCLKKMEERGIISRKQGSGIYVADHILQKRIGLVFGGNIFNPGVSAFHSQLLERCKDVAVKHGYRFSFYLDVPGLDDSENQSAPPVHQDLANALSGQVLDGLLLIGLGYSECYKWLSNQAIPSVSLSAAYYKPGTVTLDYSSVIQSGIRGLLAQNCNSVGLLGILPEHRAKFLHTSSSIGLPLEEKWIATPDKVPDWSIHENLGHQLAQQLLDQCGGRDGLPEGLVITDDILALGACEHLESIGMVIGRDIKVASHANRGSNTLRAWRGRLIAIEFDPQEVVEALFASLEALMDGNPLLEEQTKISAHIVKTGRTSQMIAAETVKKVTRA